MGHDRFHQPLADAPAAVIGLHEDVAHPGKGGVIRDEARHGDLAFLVIDPEDQRVPERALDGLPAARLRPIGLRQEITDGVQVQSARVCADGQTLALLFNNPWHCSSFPVQEAPRLNGGVFHEMIPSFLPAVWMMARACSISTGSWAAVTVARRRANPSGTAGETTGRTKRSWCWHSRVSRYARSSEPHRIGTMAVVVNRVSKPADFNPWVNWAALALTFSTRQGSSRMILKASLAAATWAGGRAAEKM